MSSTSEVRPRVVGAQRWVRVPVGLLLGAVSALGELVFLALAGVVLGLGVLCRRSAVRLVGGPAWWLAGLERRRLAACLDGDSSTGYSHRQALTYLLLRAPVGLLGGAVLTLFAGGALWAGEIVEQVWLHDRSYAGVDVDWLNVTWTLVLGLLLLYLGVLGVLGVADLDRRLALRQLGPSERERLRRRITELAVSRAGVVAAVDAERRRIERDLHDGVQQRLVALSMLLGRARRARDQETATGLLAAAHRESQRVLDDLREVAWRVYPAALDNLGLADALARVAESAGVPVRLDCALPAEPDDSVRTAVYFVVCEAVTNAAKHAAADLITVRVRRQGTMVDVRIIDDGCGGADPAGSGLSGLARRVAALDGRFALDSPVGGPTTVSVELPCG